MPTSGRHAASGLSCLTAVGLGLVAFALAGCGPRPSATAGPAREPAAVPLRLGLGAEPSALDPHVTNGIPELRLQRALWEGLVEEAPDGGPPVPAAAERWEVTPDGRIWVFHLRPGLVWSNGDPLTAEDFVWSWRRALSPALGCPYAYLFGSIEGASSLAAGDPPAEDRPWGVRALAPDRLEVRLRDRDSTFLRVLALNPFLPVHRPTIEAAGPFDRRATGWDRQPGFPTNGRFTLAEWSVHRRLVLRRNERHRDAAGTRSAELHFLPVESEDAEERMFQAGQIDVTTMVPTARLGWYRQHRPEVLRIDPYLGVYFLSLNTRHGPLGDPRVRRALSLALDRGALVENVLRGGQRPAWHFVPPEAGGGYRPAASLTESVAAARAELAAAGFAGGEALPALEFLFNTREDHRRVAEAVQAMWREHLGVRITLTNVEWKVFLARRFQAADHQIARAGWIGIYNDPQAFLSLFVRDGGNNDTGWSDPEYDRLLAAAQAATDPAIRQGLLSAAEAILLRDVPVIPLYFYTLPHLVAPEVEGWSPHPLDRRPWGPVRRRPSGV